MKIVIFLFTVFVVFCSGYCYFYFRLFTVNRCKNDESCNSGTCSEGVCFCDVGFAGSRCELIHYEHDLSCSLESYNSLNSLGGFYSVVFDHGEGVVLVNYEEFSFFDLSVEIALKGSPEGGFCSFNSLRKVYSDIWKDYFYRKEGECYRRITGKINIEDFINCVGVRSRNYRSLRLTTYEGEFVFTSRVGFTTNGGVEQQRIHTNVEKQIIITKYNNYCGEDDECGEDECVSMVDPFSGLFVGTRDTFCDDGLQFFTTSGQFVLENNEFYEMYDFFPSHVIVVPDQPFATISMEKRIVYDDVIVYPFKLVVPIGSCAGFDEQVYRVLFEVYHSGYYVSEKIVEIKTKMDNHCQKSYSFPITAYSHCPSSKVNNIGEMMKMIVFVGSEFMRFTSINLDELSIVRSDGIAYPQKRLVFGGVITDVGKAFRATNNNNMTIKYKRTNKYAKIIIKVYIAKDLDFWDDFFNENNEINFVLSAKFSFTYFEIDGDGERKVITSEIEQELNNQRFSCGSVVYITDDQPAVVDHAIFTGPVVQSVVISGIITSILVIFISMILIGVMFCVFWIIGLRGRAVVLPKENSVESVEFHKEIDLEKEYRK